VGARHAQDVGKRLPLAHRRLTLPLHRRPKANGDPGDGDGCGIAGRRWGAASLRFAARSPDRRAASEGDGCGWQKDGEAAATAALRSGIAVRVSIAGRGIACRTAPPAGGDGCGIARRRWGCRIAPIRGAEKRPLGVRLPMPAAAGVLRTTVNHRVSHALIRAPVANPGRRRCDALAVVLPSDADRAAHSRDAAAPSSSRDPEVLFA